MLMKPFKFIPYLKTVLWGGERIAPYKGIKTDLTSIGESWEISGVPGHESVVAEGNDKGLNLRELIQKYGAALVGESVYQRFGDEFPLLVKIIDARRDLSLQVHPDDALARQRHDSFGKTEMWYIIDSEPGSRIFAGLSQAITPDDYTRMVADNTIMNAVAAHDSHPGDLFFLPAGRIHAIGAGNLLAEIQQTSDITYRVYDFGRLDADGKPRQLHTELAKDAIDYTVYPEYKSAYTPNPEGETPLISCSYFDVRLENVSGNLDIDAGRNSFMIVMCLEGNATLNCNNGTSVTVVRGETVLIPAEVKAIKALGNARLLTATA